MLALLREIQRQWEEEGRSKPGIARAAEQIGEALEDVATEEDLGWDSADEFDRFGLDY